MGQSIRQAWRAVGGVTLTSLGPFWLKTLASGRQAIGTRDSDDDVFETGAMCLILGCLLLLSTCIRNPSPWMLGALYVVVHVGAATAYSLIFQLGMTEAAIVTSVSFVVGCIPVAVARFAAKDGAQNSASCD